MAASFSTELQDQFNPLAAVISTNIAFIADVRGFYNERVSLEREYATKLQALVSKTQAKANGITEALVAGDAPSKMFREGAGRNQCVEVVF